MESLSQRLYRIRLSAEALAAGVGPPHNKAARNVAAQLQALENEAQRKQTARQLPEFEDWEPVK